jgi:hypothetical protein
VESYFDEDSSFRSDFPFHNFGVFTAESKKKLIEKTLINKKNRQGTVFTTR